MSAEPQSLFDELGGEARLRAIIDRFVDRLFSDMMIGFMFERADRQRIKDMEYEFAAQHLGANVSYSGRPLVDAHRAHRIFDGHFSRRLSILRETLLELQVPPRVREHWLAHTEAQRARLVVGPCNAALPDSKT